MKRWLRWCTRSLVWAGPLLVLGFMVASGFLVWTLTTEAGTRWLLVTLVRQFDGQVQQIRGSLFHGVHVGNLRLPLPDVTLQGTNLDFKADWLAVQQGRLHILNLSAQNLTVTVPKVSASGPQAASFPDLASLRVPAWPITLALDRLAVERLDLRMDDAPFPVQVGALDLAITHTDEHAQLVLRRLALAHAEGSMTLDGEVALTALQAPWPMTVALTAQVQTQRRDSPLCVARFAPAFVSPETACTAQLQMQATGTTNAIALALQGTGQGLTLDAQASVLPLAAWPLQQARLALALGDGATVQAQVAWEQEEPHRASASDAQRISGQLRVEGLDLGRLANTTPAVLGLDSQFRVVLGQDQTLTAAELETRFLTGTHWNDQAISGHVHVQARPINTPMTRVSFLPRVMGAWRLPQLALDITVGKNRLVLDGALGQAQDRMQVQANLPELRALIPSFLGGVQVQGQVGGSVTQQYAELTLRVTPETDAALRLGTAPLDAQVALTNTWQADTQTWQAQITRAQGQYADVQAELLKPLDVAWQAPQTWTVGEAELRLSLEKTALLVLDHQYSRVDTAHWETRGRVADLSVTGAGLRQLHQYLARQGLLDGLGELADSAVWEAHDLAENKLAFALDWDVQFNDALEGRVHLRRRSGDWIIPWDTPIPVGLHDLDITAHAVRLDAGRSQLQTQMQIQTAQMGALTAQVNTVLHATRTEGVWLASQGTTVAIQADMADLAWLSLFIPQPFELGGAVTAQVQFQQHTGAHWTATGNLTGEGIRLVYVDEGVRLLDGSLKARFDDQRFVVERLYFPARLRVEPKEARTHDWVHKHPDAQNGNLTVQGEWNVMQMTGLATLTLQRYPVLQRADRYTMLSGAIQMRATLPTITVTGDLIADAGWVDLDIVRGVPTVDSDVVVLRAGQGAPPATPVLATTETALDITIDLGERFYLTGYGVDAALVGKLRLYTQAGRLNADGALETHDGTITAYGQRLQLARGTLTFQGDLTSPVLNIEAVRTGDLAVQAGVRVAGTARRPRIDLISRPEVDDVAKLSWLLLGRGPDESGSDAALLLSVGTSFFTAGEPFYREFGLDELSMRSGALGATGNLLPVDSVVRRLDSSTSEIERQFIAASKHFGQDVTLSIEQAIAGTGTVGRVSYRLARGLTAQLSAGSVNGLALVYRWFSRADE